MISKELLDKIIKYVEYTEESLDGEYGEGRTAEELMKENIMPPFYYEIVALRISLND